MSKKTRDPHPHRTDGELNIVRIPSDLDLPMDFAVIRSTLDAMQNEVGGFIEGVRRLKNQPSLKCGCRLMMIVDEEGRFKTNTPNVRATIVASRAIVGNVFLVAEGPCYGADGVEEDFVSIPNEPGLLQELRGLIS